MLDMLVIIFAVLFVYQNVRSLMELPLSQWEFVHYALAVLTVVIAGLGVWKAWQMYKKSKRKKEEEAQKLQEEEAERQERQASAHEGEDDLAYLDELDAEEDARKAKEERGALGAPEKKERTGNKPAARDE